MVTSAVASVEEYFDLLHDSEEKIEYYDGEIVAMSGAQPIHNIITVNLTAEFVFCLKKQGCLILNSDQLISIGQRGPYLFPDIVIVCKKPVYEQTKRGPPLPPVCNWWLNIQQVCDLRIPYTR